MAITDNALVAVIEEAIRLKESAQFILTEAVGGTTLTRIERLVLIMITESDRGMTASQISRHLGHPRQVVQRAVNRLLELEFINRFPNPDHKTSPLFEATQEGIDFEAEVGEKLVNIVNTLLTDSDMRMCQRVSRDLRKLRVLLESYPTDTDG